jgi:hypothetical protein
MGPIQHDLHSALLLAYLELGKTILLVIYSVWEGAEQVRARVRSDGVIRLERPESWYNRSAKKEE